MPADPVATADPDRVLWHAGAHDGTASGPFPVAAWFFRPRAAAHSADSFCHCDGGQPAADADAGHGSGAAEDDDVHDADYVCVLLLELRVWSGAVCVHRRADRRAAANGAEPDRAW